MSLSLDTTNSLIGETRVISREDKEALRLLCGKAQGMQGALVVKHHRIAQLAADGYTAVGIAEALSLDVMTVHLMLESKLMQSLISEYVADGAGTTKSLIRRARQAAFAGVVQVQKRLENPAGLEFDEILGATTAMLDRVGVGPTTKHQVQSSRLTLEDFRGLAAESNDRVIDVEVVGGAEPVPTAAGSDASSESRPALREQTEAVPEARVA